MVKLRTLEDIKEEQTRTLYVRMPHTIKDAEEIRDLFYGIARVKLPRQSGRFCHVIFPTVDEKIKNMKNATKVVNGKRIYISDPRPINFDKVKEKKPKKVKIPKLKEERKTFKTLFVSQIPLGAKTEVVRDAFPGCVTIAMLKATNESKFRTAKLKMSSPQLAAQYVSKEIEWPTIDGKPLQIAPSLTKNKSKKKKKSQPLKIYNGDESIEIKDEDTDDESDKAPSPKTETKLDIEIKSEDESDDEPTIPPSEQENEVEIKSEDESDS